MTRSLLIMVFALTSVMVQAQPFKVESVKMSWEEGNMDQTPEARHQRIAENLADIEAAKAHTKTSNNYKMWYYRGVTYLTLNNEGSDEQKGAHPDALNVATESFFKSIETDVKGKLTSLSKKGLVNCAIGHYNIGVSTFNKKDYKTALNAYSQVLKILPYDEDQFLLKQAQINKETIMLYSSYAASGAGDNAKAKELLQELIDNAYADPRIYGDMANILLEEKDTSGALKYIAMGREMDDRNVNLMRAELDLFMKLGRSEELIQKLNEAIENEPESEVLYFARAINYYNLGKDKEAEESYLKVVELDPNYADAWFNLGVIYLDRCKPIADKIAAETNYEKTLPMEEEIDALYAKAAEKFAEAMAVGDYPDDQKLDLAKNLKKLYGRLVANDDKYQEKYDETKALIKELGG
ncbi:MAG: tetratricopeptide repeat protein [Bacteroidia bacterium]|nr:tetratricopeptide repeat protein [Bacteroidia bacterium]